MSIEVFSEEVQEKILSYLPARYKKAEAITEVNAKRGGIFVHGVCVTTPDVKEVQVIYLDKYYSELRMGRQMEDILEEIAQILLEREHVQERQLRRKNNNMQKSR